MNSGSSFLVPWDFFPAKSAFTLKTRPMHVCPEVIVGGMRKKELYPEFCLRKELVEPTERENAVSLGILRCGPPLIQSRHPQLWKNTQRLVLWSSHSLLRCNYLLRTCLRLEVRQMPWLKVGHCSEADSMVSCKKKQKMACWYDKRCLSAVTRYGPHIYS